MAAPPWARVTSTSAETVIVLLADDGVLDAGIVEEAEPGLAVDAGDHDAGTPVPAGVALGLADHVEVGDAVVAGAPRDGKGLASGAGMAFSLGGAEADGDVVLARPERAGDVEAVAQERRLAGADGEAVHGDRGESIDEVEVEDRPFAGHCRWLDREAAADLPFGIADPLDVRLVAADQGIGNAPGGEEGRVHVAGDGCRPDRFAEGRVENPGAGEGKGHGALHGIAARA
ncbi:MAG: hypothetical protein J0H63_14530 [Rhizobiales bacterium]|nr:hypothetical protein [Hyphomicrobiales bacterium]